MTALFDEGAVTRIYEEASQAVVEIDVSRTVGSITIPGLSSGSGFFFDDQGHLMTNQHIVEAGSEFIVRLADGREVSAQKLGASPADDLAVLKVDPEEVADIEPLEFADSSKVRPGQLAIAIGSPFREFNSVGVGVVSGIERGHSSVLRRPIPDMIQTDVPLNPGSSGGPLLNSRRQGNRNQFRDSHQPQKRTAGGVQDRVRGAKQHRNIPPAPVDDGQRMSGDRGSASRECPFPEK